MAGKKPMHPRVMFRERMKREGRDKEFVARAKEIMRETDGYWNQSAYKAMVEWGYEAEEEKRLHAEWEKRQGTTKLRRQLKKEREEIMEDRKQESWDEVVRTLPATASPAKEVDWVGSHSAMTLKRRQRDPDKHVRADDPKYLLNCPNGDCPSQRAANLLSIYMNTPEKFFNEVMGQMKKAEAEGGTQTGVIEDMGIEEIKRMLGDEDES